MRYKGIALDLDGTFLRNDHTVSAANLAAVHAARAAGYHVVLCSSRPIRSVLQIAQRCELNGPVIGLGGAIVADRDQIYFQRGIDAATLKQIWDVSPPTLSINIYRGFEWVTPHYTQSVAEEAQIVEFEPELVNINLDTIVSAEKLLLIDQPANLHQLVNHLEPLADQINYSYSKPHYLEVTAANVSKASGIIAYGRLTELTLAEFIGIGDGGNDLDMIRRCGMGVAMANAVPAVREAADQIILSNEEDGVAHFLNQLLETENG